MVTNGSSPAAEAVANGGGVISPQSRRRSLHSPWASVVRGDSEHNASPTATAAASSEGGSPGLSTSPAAEEASTPDNSLIENSGSDPQPESTENNGDNNAGGPRRTAWNRLQNGAVDHASVIGGSTSWPALSETTRPVQRSLSDTSRPVSDGSTPSSQAPILSQPPQRSATSSSGHGNHGNSAGNNPNPARPRSRNRGGGGGGGVNSSGTGPSPPNQSAPQMPPPFPFLDLPYVMPAGLDHSARGPRTVSGNDHSSQRSNSRRGNYSPRPRGDGQYHNHHVGRREQDRRDVHQAPQFVPPPPPMGYMPPPLPPGASPYMGPLPMRVFPGQIGFDMAPSFVYMPPMPPPMPVASPPLPPVIFPSANENPLTNLIVKQIDFYFSDDNLAQDGFLKSKMDEHGWVPISLIASFRRVQHLTNDIPLILESLRHSVVVEVQGDKVRRRNEWSKWLLSTGVVNSGASSSAPVLATSLQELSLDDAMAHTNGNVDAREGRVEMATGESSGSTSQSGLANGDNDEEDRSRNLWHALQ